MFCCILAFISSAFCFLLSYFRCEKRRERLISAAVGLAILAAFGVTLYWHHTKHHAGHNVEGHQH